MVEVYLTRGLYILRPGVHDASVGGIFSATRARHNSPGAHTAGPADVLETGHPRLKIVRHHM